MSLMLLPLSSLGDAPVPGVAINHFLIAMQQLWRL